MHRWEITDEAVCALSGWLVREWQVVPISRIRLGRPRVGRDGQVLLRTTTQRFDHALGLRIRDLFEMSKRASGG